MATYFDATADADLALLPEALRDHTDLANVAARVEAEVIGRYTVSTYKGTDYDDAAFTLDPEAVQLEEFLYVCLRGYATDSAEASTRLAEALRQEIAGVVTHRLWQTRREPGLRFAIEGQLQKQYRADAEDFWPKSFGLRLRPFDVRPINFVMQPPMPSASGITVGTTVDLRKLNLALDERAARVKDLTPFFRTVVGPAMTALLKQQFASGGTTMRGGHKWAALAAATVEAKLARGTYWKGTLRDRDWMYDAFTNPAHPDAVEIVNKLRYIRSVQGEAKRIADFHQTGTSKMPARPVMGDGIPRPVARAWSGELLRWINAGRLSGGVAS